MTPNGRRSIEVEEAEIIEIHEGEWSVSLRTDLSHPDAPYLAVAQFAPSGCEPRLIHAARSRSPVGALAGAGLAISEHVRGGASKLY